MLQPLIDLTCSVYQFLRLHRHKILGQIAIGKDSARKRALDLFLAKPDLRQAAST